MPPDSAQERTEPATVRRRREARQSGQIGKSTDLNAAVILLGGLLILYYGGRHMVGRLLTVTRFCLSDDGLGSGSGIDVDQIAPTLKQVLYDGAVVLLPMLLGLLVIALVICFAQVGFLFTLRPLKPSPDRLNPIAGLGRMFNARAFVQLLMGVAKMALLVAVAWWTLAGRVGVLANVAALPCRELVGVASDLLFTLGLKLAIALLVLALIDYAYQRWKTEKDLRMTKEEIKEELKRMDGDPKLKARRRQVQFQMALQRIRSAVPKADVVITNPTEFAVVLQYDNETMGAPRLTAKGADYLAQKIRELAIEHGVPIVERPPLARALYREVEIGREIPAEFYKAVAEVLAYVYELAHRGYRPRQAAGVAMN